MNEYSIRLATENDKWMIRDWRNHPEVRSVMFTNHEISVEEHSAWWDKTRQMPERQILIYCRNKKPVGVICVYDWDHENATAWWGFYLDNNSLLKVEKTRIWLKLEADFIEYAREKLKLNALFCAAYKTNTQVCALHIKSGFVEFELEEQNNTKDVLYLKYTYKENLPTKNTNASHADI